jgi:hypothetical protein
MKTAIFWIASEDYRNEAARSAASVLAASKSHIWHDLYLATPDAPEVTKAPPFAGFIDLPPRRHKHWFLDSTRYFYNILWILRSAGYGAAVYLDTDTFVCGDLGPLFRLAEQVDFAGAFAPGRRTRATVLDVPSSFPEINIGVNLFRLRPELAEGIDDPTINFVGAWYDYYAKNVEVYGNNDQAPLREILWTSRPNFRTAVLPPEFNFRFGFGGFLRGPCVVLHGRSDDIESVAQHVNALKDFRTFGRGSL